MLGKTRLNHVAPNACKLRVEPLEARNLLATLNLIEQFPLLVAESEIGDLEHYGYAVAIDGDRAVVGAPRADYRNSTPGAAYVLERVRGQWRQQAVLQAPNVANSNFGAAVAISYSTIVVGAPGTWNDSFAGSAFVFVGSTVNWLLADTLVADEPLPNDGFGACVAVENGTIVVSAQPESSFSKPNGDRVFVFEHEENGWVQLARFFVSDVYYGSGNFGQAIAISGDRIAAGAPQARGDGMYDPFTGAVYVFERRVGVWSFQQELWPTSPRDNLRFGSVVDLQGSTLVVGVAGDGAVYSYDLDGGEFQFCQRVVGSDVANAGFAVSISLDGESLAVGRYFDGSESFDVSSVYFFHRDSHGRWQEHDKVSSTLGNADDGFALSLAMSGDAILVGALRNDAAGFDDGAVHAFEISTAQGDVSLYGVKQPAIDRVEVNYGMQGIAGPVHFAVYRSADREFDSSDLDHLVNESTIAAVNGVGVFQFDPGEFDGGQRYLIVRVTATDVEHLLSNNQLVAEQVAPLDLEFVQQDPSLVDEGTWWQSSTYGYALAADGRWAIVGARGDSQVAEQAGAVYVYELVNGQWAFSQKLLASDGQLGDGFGHAVSIDGETLVVGAPWDDGGSTDLGSVYVFKLVGDSWVEATKLSGTWNGGFFGNAVAVDDETIVIGAGRRNVYLTTQYSAAFVYELVAGQYTRVFEIRDVPGISYSYRNFLLAETAVIDGDQIALGAPLLEYYSEIAGGAVVTLKRVNGSWTYGQTLTIPHGSAGAKFGTSIALQNDLLVVGAVEKNHSDSVRYAGAAYVFELVAGQWKFAAELQGDTPVRTGLFGGAVALGEGVLYVHAWDIKSASQETSFGNLYVFRRLASGEWIREQRILDATNNGQNDYRGPIATTENFVLVRGEAPSELVDGIAAVHVLQVIGSAAPGIAGDFNRDWVVDSADYSVWRDTLGASGLTPYSGADGDGNGTVDQDDYLVWKANFGRVLVSGSGAVGTGNRLQAAEELSTARQVALNPPWRASSGTQRETDSVASVDELFVRRRGGLWALGESGNGGRIQKKPPAEPGAGGRLQFAVQHRDLALLAWRSSWVARWRGQGEGAADESAIDRSWQIVSETDCVFEELGLVELNLSTR